MNNSDATQIFVSYPRSDGELFATELHDRLVELGFQVWRDRTSIEPGKDWWQQIVTAIRQVKFMLLVMTPAALESKWMREEWRLARQEGVCVIPVLAARDLDFSGMPRWMRDSQFVSIDNPAEWAQLIHVLSCPCREARVPFMVEDLPADFVPRPQEFEQLLDLLLDSEREDPVAITAALRGAGGYGKTTLARALCHNDRIQQAFKHGVLWVSLGQNPDNLVGKVEDLIYTLSGERPGFASIEAATTRLSELLGNRDILMVIDDVWSGAHLRPFLQGGKRCARLITTRNSDTLPPDTLKINVDAMQRTEAIELLTKGLPQPIDHDAIDAMAKRLGEWPLLIKLVNSFLREQCEKYKSTLRKALDYVAKSLREDGVVAFDRLNSSIEERNSAVASTIRLSLNFLQPDERERYIELSIFPDSVDIPLAALEKLWGATGDYSPTHVEKFCDRLSDLSLLLSFDAVTRRIRLHDVVRLYLRSEKIDRAKLHARLLRSYKVRTWADLPLDEPYIWDWLAYHLTEAGRVGELIRTAKDLAYLTAKTRARSAQSAEADILAAEKIAPGDTVLHVLRRHFANAGHLLNCCTSLNDVRGTLLSRLRYVPELTSLCDTLAHNMAQPYFTAVHPLPDLPRHALIRTLTGHLGAVKDCEVSSDGEFIVSASADKTLKIWDARTGCERTTLKGHTAEVNGCAISLAAGIIVSASADKTLRVWDIQTGAVRQTLRGHTASVSDCAISPSKASESMFIVSASADKTLKVWDLRTGCEIVTLKGHTGAVYDCAIGVDAKTGQHYVVSASADKTLRIWDVETGKERAILRGHTEAVHGVAINRTGNLIISASHDRTVKVWDALTGKELRTLVGHHSVVDDCMFAGESIVSASDDNTLKVWDWKTGAESFTLDGHTDWVNRCAVSPSGEFIVSASNDTTLKMWDARAGGDRLGGQGHSDHVYACDVARWGDNGSNFAISASADKTLNIWDMRSGKVCCSLGSDLGGHEHWVRGCAIGHYFVVSASDDKTLKVWDVRSRTVKYTLRGHEASVRACQVGPDYIVSASADSTLKIWDTLTGRLRFTLDGHKDWVNACAVSPDGKTIVSASRDKTLKLWNARNGRLIRTLSGHCAGVLDCAFSPTGDRIVSAGSDGTLMIWDVRNGSQCQTLRGHTASAHGCTFSSNGELIFSVSGDKTLRAWDLDEGRCLVSLHVDGPLRACATQGDRVVAAGNRGVYFLQMVN